MIKNKRTIALIFVVLMMLWNAVLTGQKKAFVIKVKDADTYLMVDEIGVKFNARLANVDAPELSQSFGKEFADSVRILIERKMVDYIFIKKDIYQRDIVNIKFENKNLDSLMICKGWAWFKSKARRGKISQADIDFQNMMEDALWNKKGLWKCEKVCPPWVYRNLNRRNKILFCSCLN